MIPSSCAGRPFSFLREQPTSIPEAREAERLKIAIPHSDYSTSGQIVRVKAPKRAVETIGGGKLVGDYEGSVVDPEAQGDLLKGI